MKQRTKFT